MKKIFLTLLLIGLFIGVNEVKAVDYPGSGRELTATVPSDGLTLIQNEQEITVRSDGSTNLDDYSIAINGDHSNSVAAHLQAKIKINVNVPTGSTLKSGDYFNVPIEKIYNVGLNGIVIAETDWEDLIDGTGTKIGDWRVNDNQIQVVLNNNVNGKSSLTGIEVSTNDQGALTNLGVSERIGQIKIGSKTFSFRILETKRVKAGDNKIVASAGSNYMISWGVRVGLDLTSKLWDTRGQEGIFSKTIIEDEFQNVKSVNLEKIRVFLYTPISLEQGGVGYPSSVTFDVTNQFTKITQNSGETYEEFKVRVISTPLQYGVYKIDDATYKVIIYYGKIGQDTPLLNESKINTAVNTMISNGSFNEENRAELTIGLKQAYLNGITNGHATFMYAYVTATYPKTNIERTITNTATITYDGVEKQLTATGNLAPTQGSGQTTQAKVTVTKKEEGTNNLLAGAKIKLQFKDSENDWVDYYIDQNTLEKETDNTGKVVFENLPVGTFRVVESKAPIGYDGEGISEEFEVTQGSNLDKQITLTNTKHEYKVTTHYYKQGTNESISEDVIQTKYYGEEYQTSPLTNIPEGYELVGTPESATGTMGDKDVIVLYEYKLKDVILTVKHTDIEGNEISVDTIEKKYGESYETNPMENDEYELVETPSNANGTIKENITVTYKYKKKEPAPTVGQITVRYVDTEGKEIDEPQIITKEIGSTYTSQAKEIEGYTLKQKPETENYTVIEGEKILTYTYERIKLKIEVKVKGIGGTIEGNEEVLYGSDSTKDKIVITADKGYYIDKVTINGKEIGIPANSEKLSLSNFIKMTENKLIEVSFKNKPKEDKQVVSVPKTSASSIIAVIAGFILLITASLIYYFKFKKTN